MRNIGKALEWAITLPLAALIFVLLAPYFLVKRLVKGGIYNHSLDYGEDYKGRKIKL